MVDLKSRVLKYDLLSQGDDGSVLTFDAGVFKTAMTSYGGLTNRARKALKKIPAERNEEDANILMVLS